MFQSDEWYMHKALMVAKRAAAVYDEVPIGAVVVDSTGAIISRAGNSVERTKTQAAHAEVLAIARAGKKRGDWRLEECTIFVTLEPCGMCMDLIFLSRIARVVYGAASPLFSYRLDKQGQIPIYKKNTPAMVSGVCQDMAGELLKDFFKKKERTRVIGAKKPKETTDINLEQIRHKLEERRRELEEKLSMQAEKKNAPDQSLDMGDQVQSLSMEVLANALQGTEIDEYNQVLLALQKIQEGAYGICIDCGQQISEKRLKSYINASRCLVCQEVKEEQGF